MKDDLRALVGQPFTVEVLRCLVEVLHGVDRHERAVVQSEDALTPLTRSTRSPHAAITMLSQTVKASQS